MSNVTQQHIDAYREVGAVRVENVLDRATVARINEHGGTFLGTSRGRQDAGDIVDCLERMKEDWDKAQNYLVAKLANSKVSDQKKAENMTKLQIYRSIGSKIKDEFCDRYLYYKKLMFQLLDTYQLRERYVQEHLA